MANQFSNNTMLNSMAATWNYKHQATDPIRDKDQINLRNLLSRLFNGLTYMDIAQVINESLGDTIDQCHILDSSGHLSEPKTRTFTYSNSEWIGSEHMCTLVLEEATLACLAIKEDDPTRVYDSGGDICTLVLEYFIRTTLNCEEMPNCTYDYFIENMNAEQYEVYSEVCNAYEDGYQW